MDSANGAVSTSAQGELDRLLATALSQARQRLAAASDFDPFAIVTSTDARILAVDWDTTPLGKHPEVEQILDAAVAQFRHLRDSSTCTALIVNTRLSREHTDAVEVRLEHREGACMVAFLPYKRAKFGPKIEFGELKVFARSPEVWV
jgi:hypothetical protein